MLNSAISPGTSPVRSPRGHEPDPAAASSRPISAHIDAGTQIQALRFTTLLLAICLFGQRFGIPVGSQSVSAVGPLGLAVSAWFVFRGTLVFDRIRSAVFLGLVGLALLGSAWHAMLPDAFDASPSTKSLAQFLALTGFATLSFAAPVDERAFFARVNVLLALIAAAGAAQFALQFAGFGLFAFAGIVPDAWLLESGYNLAIPVGIGDILKANGFFLIEPSVFSQFMAVALIIEVVNFRRKLQMALFASGLLLSFSGTGWIVLATFFVFGGLRLGPNGVRIIAVSLAVLVAAALGMALLAPDFAAAFAERFGEISQPGTSGHMRFVTPFWLMGDVLARMPSAFLAGIGSGVSEKITLPYAFDVNTPVKVFLEYGLPLLIAYVALFALAQRTRAQGALFMPLMLLFLFTGGYQQFPPVLFPVLLLAAVARLSPSPAAPGNLPAPRHAAA